MRFSVSSFHGPHSFPSVQALRFSLPKHPASCFLNHPAGVVPAMPCPTLPCLFCPGGQAKRLALLPTPEVFLVVGWIPQGATALVPVRVIDRQPVCWGGNSVWNNHQLASAVESRGVKLWPSPWRKTHGPTIESSVERNDMFLTWSQAWGHGLVTGCLIIGLHLSLVNHLLRCSWPAASPPSPS